MADVASRRSRFDVGVSHAASFSSAEALWSAGDAAAASEQMTEGETQEAAHSAALQSASAKVRRHLLPFLILCYFVSYLDRVNIGFAALTMNGDLGIGPETFGFIAGIFFAGYCLAEVPSNIILARVGARLWIARIMVTWGLASMALALAQGPASLGVLRFLLGLAEAGFFPGIIYYLARFVPRSQRGRTISAFMAAVPVSVVLGSQVSGIILDGLNGAAGLKGWQWLFVLEALPAVLLGIAATFVLRDTPQEAVWLSKNEAEALTHAIKQEEDRGGQHETSLREALTSLRMWALSLVYFGLVVGLYGLTFWTPQIVKGFGLSNIETGFVAALPPLLGALVMVPWGWHADRTGERVWHVAIPCFVGAAGLIAGSFALSPALALAALSIGAMGVFAGLPNFWPLPAALLTGTAAAAGIALINSVANIGGFIGPTVIGWLKAAGFSSGEATAAIAAFMALSGVVVLILGDGQQRVLSRPRNRLPPAF